MGTYGERRIHAELREAQDIRVGRKRVQRLMANDGLRGAGRPARPRTTVSVPGVMAAEDLVDRDFDPAGPNLLWSADFTYIPTGEGWLYLAGVLDLLQPSPGRLEHDRAHAHRARRRARWRWPWRAADPVKGWCTTAIVDRSTPR